MTHILKHNKIHGEGMDKCRNNNSKHGALGGCMLEWGSKGNVLHKGIGYIIVNILEHILQWYEWFVKKMYIFTMARF